MQEKLNTQDSQRAYVRVIDYIKQEIRIGNLTIGSRLPPERTLAEHLNVSRNSVREALRMRNIPYHLVSRTGQGEVLSYADLTEEVMREHRLIINTTPLGMYPRVDAAPEIPYRLLTPNHMLFDLIYNPAETLFMRRGTEQGARTASGGEMLIEQAEKSWEIWNI